MRVLVACEYSGRVRQAFRALGHDAWSCDLLPAEDGLCWHLKGDAVKWAEDGCPPDPHKLMEYLLMPWDLMIAFPPCTDLCSSGARWFSEKRADGRQKAAVNFFMSLANAKIKRIAIENPIGIMSRRWRKPDQIIQPWQFGHGETKATCLWLKNLPKLTPTNIVDGREAKVHRMSPGPNRWKERSRTYQGIADAMAQQWGCGGFA